MPHYKETKSEANFPAIEKEIQKFWQENNIFEKSVSNLKSAGEGGQEFSFFDGPPFANGLPHYGHLLTSCVKDIYARYHTLKGERTERVFGWDCHGLPAEMEAEKQLGIQGQLAIEEYGIKEFNAHCQTSVMKYTSEWKSYINRVGRWVDFDNGYKTMDRNYMESVIWAFKELYKKGLVYEGHKVMPYSWACETPLSNFETRMDNAYREKVSKSAVVAFELEKLPEFVNSNADKAYILAWTTTPWTLPSNLALAVGKDVQYVAVEKDDAIYITGKKSVNLLGVEEDTPITDISSSQDIIGLRYKPLFPYFANDSRGGEKAFTILEGDFVSDEDGTGIVHLAPGFGEDDQRVCMDNGICLPENGGIICPVNERGEYTKEVFDLSEISLKSLNVMKAKNKSDDEPYSDAQLEKYGLANLRIIDYLKQKGQLIKQEDYTHNYPHCWRTDTPLIYKAVPSWYVKVTAFKDRMVELNKGINWIPSHIRDGQFGKWLENAHDWAISRNRFWGAPIPIWRSNNPDNKELYVFGSIAELQEFFGVEVDDLHRPFIDSLTKPDPLDPKYTISRVPEVLDCWFESGSMPFAELHYPFENKEKFESRFPADFIVEYVAQTRGWFYTLMILSTALFDKAPFKNCICHGVILGEPVKNNETGKMEKQKLSKRLKNYADPVEVFESLGADAIRWMMVASPVMNGGELTVSKDASDIREVIRLTLKPIWNAYHFFTLYANSDGVRGELAFESDNLMDRYILQKLAENVSAVAKSLDSYDTASACKAVEDFFEVLNNWYIRRSRERFWRESDASDNDKQAAYNTLYTCLVTMMKATSPLLPMLSEYIYKNLTGEESVHLSGFPKIQSQQVENLSVVMDYARLACNTALSIRSAENIRIRQPLAKMTLITDKFANDENFEQIKEIIKDEINVKEVVLEKDIEQHATLNLKINFPVLGKRLPDKMKQIIPASKKGEWKQLDNGNIEVIGEELLAEEFSLTLQPKEPKGTAALASNDGIVILDLEIDETLKNEGIARDIVRLIQQARKDADLNIADRISVKIECGDLIYQAVNDNLDYIKEQTLSNEINFDIKVNIAPENISGNIDSELVVIKIQ